MRFIFHARNVRKRGRPRNEPEGLRKQDMGHQDADPVNQIMRKSKMNLEAGANENAGFGLYPEV